VNIRLVKLLHWLISIPLFLLAASACLFLLPIRRIKLGIFPTERIGHLALNPDLFCRRKWLGNKLDADLEIFVAGNPANEQLLEMWQRKMTIFRLPFLHSVLCATQTLWSRSIFFQPLTMLSNEYVEFNTAPPTLEFTDEEESKGRTQLAKWGIDAETNWFVCVFARDESYLNAAHPDEGDWSYHDYRNADIDSFTPAIEEVVSRGGFVLRMGFHVAKPLSVKSPRVIDYAQTSRSDFMDIYLTAKCRFFLGTTSGIGDVAAVFDRPRIGVNWVPFGNAPFGKHSLFIPKLAENHLTGEKIAFPELLEAFKRRSDPKLWDGKLALKSGYRYIDNTPEEILDVTREMLDRIEKEYQPSEIDEKLQITYRQAFPKEHWCSGIATPIGSGFLRLHIDLLTARA